jgi:hypothetical protein
MEQPEFRQFGFLIMTEKGREIRINTDAYADDLILYAETGDGIWTYLDLLAMICKYTGMKINAKRCVALAELSHVDMLVKAHEP